jgi:hypothetical protein
MQSPNRFQVVSNKVSYVSSKENAANHVDDFSLSLSLTAFLPIVSRAIGKIERLNKK